ncbi:hypothetical protein [Marinisporobacter balticus]|uniref:DUF8052 domain-containing protein n=1 Tax=Marinisporobacter balticus TaxID=2018667 RepID=A0A4R2KYM8_9FIRM|nr:hypothetical protein [Marinisporobacter balticus]TCO71805.1 hypothetical protein EV214_12024 [Marinisporobacter balticus]
MKHIEYLENIERKLNRHFDIKKDFFCKDIKIDLFAKYFLRNERYIGSKKASIYAFENNEYCLIKYFNHLDQEKLQNFMEHIKAAVTDLVTPNEEHMSSIVTGVVVIDADCDEEMARIVEKFRFHKSFAFGFKGWVDIRLLLVSLDNHEITTNKKGKEVKDVYQP